MRAIAALALVGLASCVPGVASSADTIEITIEHSKFVPSQIEVQQGSVVTFVIENRDPIAHEFILGDEALQRVHETGTEKHHGARPGEVSVPAGTTRKTTYTFTTGEDLTFACHLPGHYDYGMRGAVKVR